MDRRDVSSRLERLGDVAIDRRTLLRAGAFGAGAAFLAACGAKTSSAAKNTAGKSTTTATEDVDFIKKTFVTDPAHAGAGLTLPMGAGLLLSTSQAPYGQASLHGINLAIKQIKAAGGPTFTVDVKDLAASTTAGADAARQWGSQGRGMALGAGFFGTGSMLPALAQYKIFTIDPGGGTSTAFQSKPYAWGGRAITPNDAFPGVLKYLKQKMPDAKRFAVTGYDIGALTTGAIKQLNDQAKQFGPDGAHVVGKALVPLPGEGTPDYRGAISKLRSMNPDVIFDWAWGSDPASFMKNYGTSGMKAPVIGPDYIASTTNLAGSLMNGYLFAYDYFDPNRPSNEWASHFVSAYRRDQHQDPDYYPANYYECVFMLWMLVQRVLAKGGDPKSGEQLQAALEANPTLPSVYGKGSATGQIQFDTATHTLSSRPMGLFVVKDLEPKPLAYFNIGGADFRMA